MLCQILKIYKYIFKKFQTNSRHLSISPQSIRIEHPLLYDMTYIEKGMNGWMDDSHVLFRCYD